MAFDVKKVVNVNVQISAKGLGFANFGSALFIVPFADASYAAASYEVRTYGSTKDIAEDFPTDSQAYQMGTRWFSQIPSPIDCMIGVTKELGSGDTEPSVLDSLEAFRDNYWWYWTAFAESYQSNIPQMSDACTWGDANGSFIALGTTDQGVLSPLSQADISYVLTNQGSRHCGIFYHSTDPYAGIELAARFATVDYAAFLTTITGEFKKLPGVPADDLTSTAYNTLDSKNTAYYTLVSSAGSVDRGRCINTLTTSTFLEYWDDVVNIDAFVNQLQVELYNVLTGQTTKLPQTPRGQQVLQGTAMAVGNAYIANGFLGERLFTNPFTGEEELSPGYFMISKATDILNISSSARSSRKSAPVQMMIFPAGAIHSVNVTVDVF
jgi:hypothetical protein